MHKIIKLLLSAMMITAITLLFLGASESRNVKYDAFGKEIIPIKKTDIEKIEKGMTRREVMQILGGYHFDPTGIDYPMSASWYVDDGSTLHLVFESSDYKDRAEFQKDFLSEDFYRRNGLPDYKREYDDDHNVKMMTEEMVDVLRKWIGNMRLISGKISKNGETTVLFEAF